MRRGISEKSAWKSKPVYEWWGEKVSSRSASGGMGSSCLYFLGWSVRTVDVRDRIVAGGRTYSTRPPVHIDRRPP